MLQYWRHFKVKLNAHRKQAYQQTDISLKIIHHFGEQQAMSVRCIRAFARLPFICHSMPQRTTSVWCHCCHYFCCKWWCKWSAIIKCSGVFSVVTQWASECDRLLVVVVAVFVCCRRWCDDLLVLMMATAGLRCIAAMLSISSNLFANKQMLAPVWFAVDTWKERSKQRNDL